MGEEAFAFVSCCCWCVCVCVCVCVWVGVCVCVCACDPLLAGFAPVLRRAEQIHSIPAMRHRLGGWVALLTLVLGLFGCFIGPAPALPKRNPLSVARWAETAENDGRFYSSYENHPWVLNCTSSLGRNAAAEWSCLFGAGGFKALCQIADCKKVVWGCFGRIWFLGVWNFKGNCTKHVSKERIYCRRLFDALQHAYLKLKECRPRMESLLFV